MFSNQSYLDVQIYKKVLLYIMFTFFLGVFDGCQRNTIPSTYPNKPGFFPITIPYKEYRLKRTSIKGVDQFVRFNKKRKKQFDKLDRKIEKKQGKNQPGSNDRKKDNQSKVSTTDDLALVEIVPDEESQKLKKDVLKEQEQARKRHFEMQTPDVQKRMKESLKESEKLRTNKWTFWDRIRLWLRNCIKW